MHRDKGRQHALRVILIVAFLALAITGVAFGTTHADAFADFSWGAGAPGSR